MYIQCTLFKDYIWCI